MQSTPDIRYFIMATAGHVDHGKSALVKALTGTDPDRLPEEKARGITIDLGFAQLKIPSSEDKASAIVLGIVDVPGHEDFVKNMVAGVGSIDLALLVVAADDGWMPQTEEHLQILTHLGVTRAVVALTKVDLRPDERSLIENIRAHLFHTPFAGASIVPTSVLSGRGVEELKTALSETLEDMPAPRDIGKPRLFIDRAFTLRGIGTVVTGTLTGGTFTRGQAVVLHPSGKTARIRNIQSHNQDAEVAKPGTRTALNLSDVAVDELSRGMVVSIPELGKPARVFDGIVNIPARANCRIKNGTHVRLHHGSSSTAARIALFSEKELNAGEKAFCRLRTDEDLFVFAGDRFVVRDSAGQNTLAGGLVLDPEPPRKLSRSEVQLKLRQRAEAPIDPLPFVASQISHDRAVRAADLLLKSRFDVAEISGAVRNLAAEGKITVAGSFAVDAVHWRSLCQRAAELIDSHHRTRPQEVGLTLANLRINLKRHLPSEEFLEAIVALLCANGLKRTGSVLHRDKHRRQLPPQLQAAASTLRDTLSAKSFDPPSRKQLAPDSASQQALRFLIESGEAVDVGEDIVMDAKSWKRLTNLVSRYIQHKGRATVGELRDALLCSRRVIVPLLERMDRDGITVRNGDARILRPK